MLPMFGKTTAINFVRKLQKNPRLLTRNSYLNFLRDYKAQHPKYGLRKILKTGFKIWTNLKPSERKMFKQKRILAHKFKRFPRLVRQAKFGGRHKLPHLYMPKYYKKRSLSASKTIKRRRRNFRQFLRYGRRKFPGNFHR